MTSSMSRKGDCWDNAVTETLFGSLKVERLHGMRFETRRLAKDEMIDWITFYNHRSEAVDRPCFERWIEVAWQNWTG